MKHFQGDYAPVHHGHIQHIVEHTLREIAICKVAHANTLSEQGISEDTIDNMVLTPETLTISLMGFMAEEAVISQRLGPLGKKKEK